MSGLPDDSRGRSDASLAQHGRRVAIGYGQGDVFLVVDPSRRLGTPPVTLVEAGGLGRLRSLFGATLTLGP